MVVDCMGKEITTGAAVILRGQVLEMAPGNNGNDNVVVRTAEKDAVTQKPQDLNLNAALVEVMSLD